LKKFPLLIIFHQTGHFSCRSIFHLPSECHEGGRDPATKNLPVMIFATDAIKVCHSGGGETNILVQLDGIPTQLFATIQLFDESLRDWGESCTFPEWMRREMAGKLVQFLSVHQLTPPVKEILFHFLAKILRQNHKNYGSQLTSELVNALKIFGTEFKNLFDTEKSSTDLKLFSTYLQSLFELTSACRQVCPDAACQLTNSQFASTVTVLNALQSISEGCPIQSKNISSVRKLRPSCHTRLLILDRIPKHLKHDLVRRMIQKTLDRIGGIYMNEIFVPAADKSSATSSDLAAISGQGNSGFAVVEFRVGRKVDEAKTLIEKVDEFHRHDDLDLTDREGGSISFTVSKVDENLICSTESCQEAFEAYVKQKLVSENEKSGQSQLGENSCKVLTKLFESCCNGVVVPLEKVLRDGEQGQLLLFLKTALNVDRIDEESVHQIVAFKRAVST